MSLVSHSQFNLARSRRALEQAINSGNWAAIRRLDDELNRALNAAFDDSTRDPRVLVNEMEFILGTYSRLLAQLATDTGNSLGLRAVTDNENPGT